MSGFQSFLTQPIVDQYGILIDVVHFVGGGSGFVGRHVQKCLRRKGYSVKIVSRHPQKDDLTWVRLKSGIFVYL